MIPRFVDVAAIYAAAHQALAPVPAPAPPIDPAIVIYRIECARRGGSAFEPHIHSDNRGTYLPEAGVTSQLSCPRCGAETVSVPAMRAHRRECVKGGYR